MTKLIVVYLLLTSSGIEERQKEMPGYPSYSACSVDIDRAVTQPHGPDVIVVGAYCLEEV